MRRNLVLGLSWLSKGLVALLGLATLAIAITNLVSPTGALPRTIFGCWLSLAFVLVLPATVVLDFWAQKLRK